MEDERATSGYVIVKHGPQQEGFISDFLKKKKKKTPFQYILTSNLYYRLALLGMPILRQRVIFYKSVLTHRLYEVISKGKMSLAFKRN